MHGLLDKSCSGSRGLPREEPVDRRGDRDVGTCPVCLQSMKLGYAGLLPVHEPRPA